MKPEKVFHIHTNFNNQVLRTVLGLSVHLKSRFNKEVRKGKNI